MEKLNVNYDEQLMKVINKHTFPGSYTRRENNLRHWLIDSLSFCLSLSQKNTSLIYYALENMNKVHVCLKHVNMGTARMKLDEGTEINKKLRERILKSKVVYGFEPVENLILLFVG